ncbi:MAG: hypothetical protein U0638_12525 [Phycisphaerales bacterium]
MSDDDFFTNRQRAERFDAAVRGYNDEYDDLANFIDLLADARHWCDHRAHSYAEAERVAHQHYLAEREDESRNAKSPGRRP